MEAKRILVPTDFSSEAQRAVTPACHLADSIDADLTALHVVHMIGDPHMGTPVAAPAGFRDYEADRKEAEEALSDQVKDWPTKRPVDVRAVVGVHVARSITDEAESAGANLIALSSHGRSGWRRFVLGSVAEEVVRRATVPVLCFPPPKDESSGEWSGPKHILITTDLDGEALPSFDPALKMAGELGCKVTLLHVVPELFAIPHGSPLAPPIPSPDNSRQLALAREKVEAMHDSLDLGDDVQIQVISHQTASKGVVEFAEQNGVDLIAASTHGRRGLRRLALGSVTDEILRRSTLPVLTFHQSVTCELV